MGLVLFATALFAVEATPEPAGAALPSGFSESVAFSGLTNPTVVKFAADGRVFVAEKSGVIKVFDGLDDSTATVFADLRTNVHNFWDRGLLGMALHPAFPTNPSVYVAYTYDAPIGGTAPRWGTPGATSDGCPTPPGPTADGCVVSGRVSKLTASGDTATREHVLINDWCQQYPSHTVGSLEFGADGMLYASAGDGASFTFTDYGQEGDPPNPCGDPPGPPGTALTPPTAEGGTLRSQDVRTMGDPLGLDGTVIRIDPDTGEGAPGNPMASSADANARRVIAAGLRNPFRMTVRPGTNEMWMGDVGYGSWEEINRLANPVDGTVDNFGWPCYEGRGRNETYDAADLNICENLYAAGSSAVVPPVFAYHHNSRVVADDTCPIGSSSVSGIAFEFYADNAYPPEYQGALFFADYSRDCIWVMMKGSDGRPNPGNIRPFVTGAASPVNLEIGPTGELFYADFDGGTIRRIRYRDVTAAGCGPDEFKAEYFTGRTPGTAPVHAQCEQSIDHDWGWGGPGNDVPIYDFSARWTGSHTFTEGTYRFTATADDGIRVWVDGDLIIDKWIDQKATTYTATKELSAGRHSVKVEYYERSGEAVAKLRWSRATSNKAPTPTVETPSIETTWKVGDVIEFSGSATDAEQGALPASALSWRLDMRHCPSNCHTHTLQTFTGVESGSFTAPDHEYPSHLELRLTATDSEGATSTAVRRLDPRTVTLTFKSNPVGLRLAVGPSAGTTPFTTRLIVGSTTSMSAPTRQTTAGVAHTFRTWSDGGALTHNFVVPSTGRTYIATYDTEARFTPFASVNFQPISARAYPGYVVDNGGPFGKRNGLTYGWNGSNYRTKDVNSSRSPDQRYDTHIRTYVGGPYVWQIAVPNGTYRVRVVAGDPAGATGNYRFNVEGRLTITHSPTTSVRWSDATIMATVNDGRLMISNAPGASNNKLAFVTIERRL